MYASSRHCRASLRVGKPGEEGLLQPLQVALPLLGLPGLVQLLGLLAQLRVRVDPGVGRGVALRADQRRRAAAERQGEDEQREEGPPGQAAATAPCRGVAPPAGRPRGGAGANQSCLEIDALMAVSGKRTPVFKN